MTATGLQNRAMRAFNALFALRAAALVACWLLVAAGGITFGFFYATFPTRWYNVRATEFITWRNTLILQYTFTNGTTGRTTPLLSGSLSFILIWQWCGTLAVALGSAGLLWLSATSASMTSCKPRSPKQKATGSRRLLKSVGSAAKKVAIRCRRLLGWRVPPRGIWRWLLGPGGLTLLDLLLILLWFGLHIMWVREMTMRTLDSRRAVPPPPKAKAPLPAPITSAPIPSSKAPMAASSPSSSPSSSPARSLLRRLLQTSSSPSPSSSSPSSSPKPASSPGLLAKAPPPAAAKKVKPLKDVVEESVAKYFGWVGRLDILLLFFPLPRCNFLHWLLACDFPALIKYHRWLGYGTLLIYSLHGITYMSIWTHDGVLKTMLNWGMDAGVNRLSGLVALCSGWTLLLTALPFVRRRLFNLFYGCHILGAVIFMLFAFMHRKDVMTLVMPGILLYLLDVVLRTIQQNFNCVRLSAAADDSSCAATASVSPEGRVLSLSIRCHESVGWLGGGTVFLNVPAISWWQWHPFTIASAPSPYPGSGESRMELRIKSYGRWTKALISRLSNPKASPVNLYVSGPYDSGNHKWMQEYDTHVFVAGGIGVTPAMGMIQQLIAFRNGRACGETGRLILIWVSRSMDELKVLPYEILQEAGSCSSRGKAETSWLQLRLFLTDGGAAKVPPPSSPLPAADAAVPACPSTDSRSSDSGADSVASAAGAFVTEQKVAAVPPAVTSAAVAGPTAAGPPAVPGVASDKCDPSSLEACTTTCARPLSHPYMFSRGLWMVAVVLCFGGAFAGLICAQAYDAHMSRTVAVRKDFSYVGMLQFAAVSIGAVLPPAVLLLAAHLYRRFRPNSASPSSSIYPSSSFATSAIPGLSRWAAATEDSAAVEADGNASKSPAPFMKSPSSAAAIPAALESYVTYGRPDLPALLKQLALSGDLPSTTESVAPGGPDEDDAVEPAAELRRVGVFAAGPAPLVGSVADLCASLNGLWGRRGRAYLDFTELSFEL